MPVHKVLLVASKDQSGEPVFLVSRVLRSNGYSPDLCHAETDGRSKIKADKLLDPDTSTAEYLGVIFMDDGWDFNSARNLCEKAMNRGLVIGGCSIEGCLVLAKSGTLKGHYVCDGLPEEAYEGVKSKVSAPSVRSNKVITSLGSHPSGFGVVFVDALGGKVKKVIHSGNSAEAIKSLSDELSLASALSIISDVTPRIKISASEDIAEMLCNKGASCVIPSRKVRILGTGDGVVVGSDPNGKSNRFIPRLAMGELLRDLDGTTARMERKFKALENKPLEIKINTRRGEHGWGIVRAWSDLGEPEEILAKAFGKAEAPYKMSHLAELSLDACCVANSMVEEPTDLNELEISFKFEEDKPVLDSLFAAEYEVDEIPEQNEEKRSRMALERELGHEGVFLQPDGKIMLRLEDGPRKLDIEDAIELLRVRALAAVEREIREEEAKGEANAWSQWTSLRQRHVLRNLAALLGLLGLAKTASVKKFAADSFGGANFGMSMDDLDLKSRVWPYEEEEDWLRDKDTYICGLQRYRPQEKDDGKENPNSKEYGIAYIWEEMDNNPYSWRKRLQESPYKLNTALKP